MEAKFGSVKGAPTTERGSNIDASESHAPEDSGLTARAWIVAQTEADLEVTEVGALPTPEGLVSMIDPLVFAQPPNFVQVPNDNGRIAVFFDRKERRNSKLALIFSDETVAGGDDVGVCAVDAGMASIFTPATHRAMTKFVNEGGDHFNIYDEYFMEFDEPDGGERKIVSLPDGTPVPYIHSGWGDGGYPVFTLNDVNGRVVAIYTDFLGKDERGAWLTPPGVTLS